MVEQHKNKFTTSQKNLGWSTKKWLAWLFNSATRQRLKKERQTNRLQKLLGDITHIVASHPLRIAIEMKETDCSDTRNIPL
jgi:hypothetical protein